MAGKFKTKRPIRRKRAIRRRRGGKRGGTTLFNGAGLQPFASRFITKMKYSGTYGLSGIALAPQQMNLNSVFDPDRTGVGHQPYGFDQLSALYNRYRVISCNYVVNVYSANGPLRFAVMPSNNPSWSPGSMSEICENPRAQFRIQLPGGNTQMIKGKVNIPSLMGRTKAQYMADDDLQAQNSQSPNELAVLNIWASGLADAPTTGINALVTLEYLVEWFDPYNVAQS